MTNAAPMKRLPPIDVLRPGHAHENIVSVVRIVSGLRCMKAAATDLNLRDSHLVSEVAAAALSSCNSRRRTIARAAIEKNGADGISDLEHVAIGNRAGRRQRS